MPHAPGMGDRGRDDFILSTARRQGSTTRELKAESAECGRQQEISLPCGQPASQDLHALHTQQEQFLLLPPELMLRTYTWVNGMTMQHGIQP